MGKYMKKSKLTGGIAVMEVSPQSSPGFRARASKTLALQRLNKSFSHSAAVSSPRSVSSSSNFQLRNRRLEKPPMFRQPPPDGECCGAGLSSTDSTSKREFADSEKEKIGVETESGNYGGFDDCFGENLLEIGGGNCGTAGEIPRTRSLVRNSSTNETSRSMRMETNSHTAHSRVEMEFFKSIPTANDIEEFFAREELWHQRTFIQKYNFDFASEMPLQGRYEWVQVAP